MQKIIIGVFIGVLGAVGLIAAAGFYKINFTNDNLDTPCTMEAKICPDGSAVGRTGPDCEFTPCPDAQEAPNQAACTEEAKICPDGSAVGRTEPNCEFAPCPSDLPTETSVQAGASCEGVPCPELQSAITEAEAQVIAEKYCIKGGEALGEGLYNPNSKTWWFDANLNATREGCNPACVVSEETKTAEINWCCTGLRQ
jgi:hypothetical protein